MNTDTLAQSSENEQAAKASSDFMLEEYRILQERAQGMRNEGVVRLNFYIGLTSALIGGILVLGNNAYMSPLLFKSAFLGILFLLAVIGLDVFRSIIIRNQVIDKAERGMGRIRRYFVEQDPSLAQFLIYRIHDEPTFWLTDRSGAGMRRTAQLLVCFTIGLGIGTLADLLSIRVEGAIILGVAAFILVFVILESRAQRLLKQALTQAQREVMFPKDSQVLNQPKNG